MMGRSRRRLLRSSLAMAAAASTSLSGCMWLMGKRQHQIRQVQEQQQQAVGGPPVSFQSERKRVTKSAADRSVATKAAFITAVQTPKTTVWIPEGVTIDLTRESIQLAPGVTIASNRNLGSTGGKGGLIKTTQYDQKLLIAKGDCRVTGIRLEGPRTDYFDPPHENLAAYESSGIQFEGNKAIVDNCEMFGWTFAAIAVGTNDTPTQGWIHHNTFRDNQMNHLGYPMELFNGLSLVEWNYFSKYRHAIAGFGYKTNGYEARFNVVGPTGGAPNAFAFDMHRLGEQDNFPDGNMTGGKYVNVHHNVFEIKRDAALSLSGIPTKHARFVNNWCAEKEGVVSGVKITDLRVKKNKYGAQAVEEGRQRLEQLSTQLPLSNGKPSVSNWTLPEQQQTSKKN